MKKLIIDWRFYYRLVGEFQEFYSFKKFTKGQNLRTAFDFRDSLVTEEWKEFLSGLKDKDIIQIADGLGDTAYVLLGAMWTFSDHKVLFKYYEDQLIDLEKTILKYFTVDQFYSIFIEIHRSNMSKSCKNIDEVYATMAQEKYKDIKYRYEQKGSLFNILIDEDYPEKDLKKNKLLKSIGYSSANLEFVKSYNINI